MAVFEQMNKAVTDRDADAYLALYDEAAVFVRHQSGAEMNKAQFGEMIRKMTASDDMNLGERRRVYENDDILVVQSINDYPDGSREAVLMACTKKDGKICRVENGATPLQKWTIGCCRICVLNMSRAWPVRGARRLQRVRRRWGVSARRLISS